MTPRRLPPGGGPGGCPPAAAPTEQEMQHDPKPSYDPRMPRHSTSLALTATAILLCTGALLADGGSAGQAPRGAPPRPGDSFDPAVPHTQRKPTMGKLFDQLSEAKVQMSDAITEASAAVPGGLPIRATRRAAADGDTYEVTLLVGDDERVVRVSARNGVIVENKLSSISPSRRESLGLLRTRLAPAKLQLGAAAAPALAKFGDGRVLAMNAVMKGEQFRYEVAVIGPDRMASYLVDPMTGEARPAAEEAQRALENPYRRAFDEEKVGPPVGEWKVEGTRQSGPIATWAVVADPSAPSAPNVLALTASEHGSDSTYNLCWSSTLRFQDGRVTIKFKPVGGVDDQGGGVMWRVKDKDNYYVARANPAEENFRVYVVKDGVRKQLASAKTPLSAGQWHTMSIGHDGDRIECFLDGLKHLAVNDATLPGEGGVGFWTKADATTAFDDLWVEPKRVLAAPPPERETGEGAAAEPATSTPPQPAVTTPPPPPPPTRDAAK